MSLSLTEDKTNLEHFNNYLREFINQLLIVFPEAKTRLELSHNDLLKINNCKNDTYVKVFMKRIRPWSQQLKDKNDVMFAKGFVVIDGIDLGQMWRDKKLSDNSRKSIWKYLTLLYVIGGTVVSKPDKLEKLIKDFETYGEKDAPVDAQAEALQQMLNNLKEKDELGEDPDEEKESSTGGFDIKSLLGGLGGKGGVNLENILGGLGGEGGMNLENLLGKNNFLSGLMDDIKNEFSDMDMPENPTDISSVFKSFSDPTTQNKMQNIFGKMAKRFEEGNESGKFNAEEIQKNASQMMNAMGISQEQLKNQAEQMGLNQQQVNRLKNSTRDQAARERLQKKLEQRKHPNN